MQTSTGDDVDDVVCGFFNIAPQAWKDNADLYKKGNPPDTVESKRVAAMRGFAVSLNTVNALHSADTLSRRSLATV